MCGEFLGGEDGERDAWPGVEFRSFVGGMVAEGSHESILNIISLVFETSGNQAQSKRNMTEVTRKIERGVKDISIDFYPVINGAVSMMRLLIDVYNDRLKVSFVGGGSAITSEEIRALIMGTLGLSEITGSQDHS